MIKLHESGIISASPNIFSYTAVINSCAFCENDELEKRGLKFQFDTEEGLEHSLSMETIKNMSTFFHKHMKETPGK